MSEILPLNFTAAQAWASACHPNRQKRYLVNKSKTNPVVEQQEGASSSVSTTSTATTLATLIDLP